MTWDYKISEAESSKPQGFTDEDKEDVDSWYFCAMADRKEFLSKMCNGYDLTKEAHEKGVKFADCVENDDVEGARKTYNEIMKLPKVLVSSGQDTSKPTYEAFDTIQKEHLDLSDSQHVKVEIRCQRCRLEMVEERPQLFRELWQYKRVALATVELFKGRHQGKHMKCDCERFDIIRQTVWS